MRTALTVLLGIGLGYGLALGCQKRDVDSQAAPAKAAAGSPKAPPQSAATGTFARCGENRKSPR